MPVGFSPPQSLSKEGVGGSAIGTMPVNGLETALCERRFSLETTPCANPSLETTLCRPRSSLQSSADTPVQKPSAALEGGPAERGEVFAKTSG